MSKIRIIEEPVAAQDDLFQPVSTEGLYSAVRDGESTDAYFKASKLRAARILDSLDSLTSVPRKPTSQ